MSNFAVTQRIPSILIVDDTPANLVVLSEILKKDGYKVRPVPNGELALQAARNEKPDLILLDIMMPDMNGLEVCTHLKEDAYLQDIPVIFISALTETSEIINALNTGGVDYITKPFAVAEVKARVENHLKLHWQNQELQRLHAMQKNETRILERLIHASEEFIQFPGDSPDYAKIVRTALDISGADYAALNLRNISGIGSTTVATTVKEENIEEGFPKVILDVFNKQYHKFSKFDEQKITRFFHLNELFDGDLSKNDLNLFEKATGIQEAVIVKIGAEDKATGNFILFFKKGETLANSKFINLYAHQLGLFFDRNSITNSLRISEAKSSAILNSLPDMLFIQNKEGVYLDFYLPENTVKFDPPKVFVGQRMENVLPENVIREFKPIMEKAFATRKIQFYNYSLLMPDKEHFFEARVMSHENDVIINIVRDVTTQKEIEIELKLKNQLLIKADLAKNFYMSVLAHDLKSPFNSLLGLSDLLRKNIREYDRERIEKIAQNINKSAESTYNLLEALLIWAQSQSGKIRFEPEKLSITTVCRDVIDNLKPAAETKNITLNLLDDEEFSIFADANMLKTILRNLISNAIKFTQKGGRVDVQAKKTNSGNTITVADNGIGISPELTAALFDMTQTHSRPGTEKETGTGLGLLICKDFAENHGGSIRVESAVGKGSVFYLDFPNDSVTKKKQINTSMLS